MKRNLLNNNASLKPMAWLMAGHAEPIQNLAPFQDAAEMGRTVSPQSH